MFAIRPSCCDGTLTLTSGTSSVFADLLRTGGYSLAHGLLASLHTREAVTTNYDSLYETATRTANRTCAVLPYEPVLDQHRWLLKLHGTVELRVRAPYSPATTTSACPPVPAHSSACCRPC